MVDLTNCPENIGSRIIDCHYGQFTVSRLKDDPSKVVVCKSLVGIKHYLIIPNDCWSWKNSNLFINDEVIYAHENDEIVFDKFQRIYHDVTE